MSEFKHTPEPWDNDTVRIIKAGTEIHGIIVPVDIRALSEDNYQRAKACVNHCKGATNYELEATSHEELVSTLEKELKGIGVLEAEIEKLKAQRDELLSALELYMKRLNDGWLTNLGWREDTHTKMQQAINNAKGGQQ